MRFFPSFKLQRLRIAAQREAARCVSFSLFASLCLKTGFGDIGPFSLAGLGIVVPLDFF
jgi:hypothetical protein